MATDGATLTPLADSPDELTRLRREAESLRASLQHTQSRLAESSREVEFLRTLRDQLLEQQQEKERTIASLQHQLQQLLRRYPKLNSAAMPALIGAIC